MVEVCSASVDLTSSSLTTSWSLLPLVDSSDVALSPASILPYDVNHLVISSSSSQIIEIGILKSGSTQISVLKVAPNTAEIQSVQLNAGMKMYARSIVASATDGLLVISFMRGKK